MFVIQIVSLSKIFFTHGWSFSFDFVITARKSVFPRSWNFMESLKRPSKHHLSINFLAEKKIIFPITEKFKTRTSREPVNIIYPSTSWLKKDRISHHQKVQNKSFSVISKYYLFQQLLDSKKTIFPITKKFKTITFQ